MATPRKWPGRAAPSRPSATPSGSTQVAKPGGYISAGGGANRRSTPAGLRERGVVLEVARICREILRVAELGGVHEEARDEDVRLGARRREERLVAGVQRAHRRHEPDDAAPWDVELRERLDDDHGWVASTSAV